MLTSPFPCLVFQLTWAKYEVMLGGEKIFDDVSVFDNKRGDFI